jgi:hypothetical protein
MVGVAAHIGSRAKTTAMVTMKLAQTGEDNGAELSNEQMIM